MEYYLGIDIGASGGRHMLGCYIDGKLKLEEIYRFHNAIQTVDGQDCWDTEHLFREVVEGIRRCVCLGKIPKTLAIDTWGCDFVLLDKNKNRIGSCVSYRDNRVEGMMEKAFAVIKQAEIYQRTGIQFQKFNTLYQLLAIREKAPEQLAKAEYFLMIPDYLNFLLTGKIVNEYTNASTTQLVDAKTQTWDREMMDRLGFPKSIFKDFTPVGEEIGCLKPELQKQLGANIMVVQAASHDTASAYLGAKRQDEIILSSGTWSLLGCILPKPLLTEAAKQYNFTNEGHVGGRYRFLKNIMGLWIVQEIRRCLENPYSFSELAEMARKIPLEPMRIDVNDKRYLHPQNMVAEIEAECLQKYRRKPESIGEMVNIVYHSLAYSYANAVKELEDITGRKYNCMNIVGGGCKNEYLNELTRKYTGKEIIIGPAEATVTGNIKSQEKRR